MNWISKGDRATAPFSKSELSKSECVLRYHGKNPTGNASAADSRSVPKHPVRILSLKILIIRIVERSERLPERSEGNVDT